eukprot:15436936-Alexandrium_andersonii.AAC.1
MYPTGGHLRERGLEGSEIGSEIGSMGSRCEGRHDRAHATTLARDRACAAQNCTDPSDEGRRDCAHATTLARDRAR